MVFRTRQTKKKYKKKQELLTKITVSKLLSSEKKNWYNIVNYVLLKRNLSSFNLKNFLFRSFIYNKQFRKSTAPYIFINFIKKWYFVSCFPFFKFVRRIFNYNFILFGFLFIIEKSQLVKLCNDFRDRLKVELNIYVFDSEIQELLFVIIDLSHVALSDTFYQFLHIFMDFHYTVHEKQKYLKAHFLNIIQNKNMIEFDIVFEYLYILFVFMSVFYDKKDLENEDEVFPLQIKENVMQLLENEDLFLLENSNAKILNQLQKLNDNQFLFNERLVMDDIYNIENQYQVFDILYLTILLIFTLNK